ncbi:MAG: hypothetical protein HQL32_11415 [Planctomycetes bacterium]|nr:hypothetical protein [Planctomycetota bacterium]
MSSEKIKRYTISLPPTIKQEVPLKMKLTCLIFSILIFLFEVSATRPLPPKEYRYSIGASIALAFSQPDENGEIFFLRTPGKSSLFTSNELGLKRDDHLHSTAGDHWYKSSISVYQYASEKSAKSKGRSFICLRLRKGRELFIDFRTHEILADVGLEAKQTVRKKIEAKAIV